MAALILVARDVVTVLVSLLAWTTILSDSLWGTGTTARMVLYFLPPFLFIASLVAIIRVDRFVFSRGYQIEDLKPWMQTMLAVQALVYLVVPLSYAVFEPVVAVLPMLPLVATPLFLVNVSIKEDRVRIRTLQSNARSIFDFLAGVGHSLGSDREPENILHSAIETMTSATEADAAVAILMDGGKARVSSVVGLFPPPVPVPEIIKSKQGALRRFVMSLDIGSDTPVWGKTLQTGAAVHIAEAGDDPVLAKHCSDRVLRLRSMLVLPLRVRGNVLGLLSVVRRGDSRPFSSAEFDHARTMTNFVAVTLDNYYTYRIQRDVEIGGDIQKRLQAPPAGTAGAIEFAEVSRPARGVSGDYYDVISIDDNRGVSGAVEEDRFATASVIVFDAAEHRLSYANAAHHPALLLSSEGDTVAAIDAEGLPIGIEETGQYYSRSVAFPAGSTLVLVTDGVLEAFNPEGEEFGDERFYDAVRSTSRDVNGRRSSDSLLQGVVSRLDAFVSGAPQHDDITLLVCSSRS